MLNPIAKGILVASLVAWLAGCGARDSLGAPVASGKLWFFNPGTNSPQTVWADATETETLSQPVPLDAGGRATVYAKDVVDILVEDSSGAELGTLGNANEISASEVSVDPAVSTGPHLSDSLIAALGSFGGPDFQFLDSVGATPMAVGAWMSSVQINVKSYGAKGDGLAIDTTPIQKAINRAKALGGGVVYFPPGTYLIDAALSLSSGTGVTLAGAGQFSSTIKQTNAGVSAILLSACTGCGVRSLGITHSAVSVGAGIAVGGGSNTIVINDVQVAPGKFRYGFTADLTTSLSVRDSSIGGAGSGVDVLSRAMALTNSSGVTVSGGAFSNSAGIVFDFQSLTAYSVVGSFFTGSTGIALTSCNKGTVVACPSLRDLTTPFSVNAVDTSFFQWGNGVDGQTVDLTSGTAYTPNQYLGTAIRLRGITTGAAYTINVPTIAPTQRGFRLYFHLFNNAGGAVTGWTFAAGYHQATGAAAISLVDLHHTMITFEYDLDAGVWRECGQRTDSV